MKQILFTAVALLPILCAIRLGASDDECTRTSRMRIYSDAFVAAESGDLDGYELALGEIRGSAVDALLFVYEGSAADGIGLRGHISGKVLSIEGDWVEHLIQYPSRKENTQKHHVKINGTLERSWFQGEIEIEGITEPQKARLRRVSRIWVCKK